MLSRQHCKPQLRCQDRRAWQQQANCMRLPFRYVLELRPSACCFSWCCADLSSGSKLLAVLPLRSQPHMSSVGCLGCPCRGHCMPQLWLPCIPGFPSRFHWPQVCCRQSAAPWATDTKPLFRPWRSWSLCAESWGSGMPHITCCWRRPAFCLSRGQSPSQVGVNLTALNVHLCLGQM